MWRDPAADDRFLCNYSEWRLDDEGEPRQNILFALSEDLLRWHKFGDAHLFAIDEGLYERYGRWDCINTLPRAPAASAAPGPPRRTGGGRDCAAESVSASATTACIGVPCPRPRSARMPMSPGAMVEAGGTLHAMFGRDRTMAAYTAQHFAGPYRLDGKTRCLLARHHAYFSRTFAVGEEVLVNHHAMDGRRVPSGRVITYAAPFKRFTVDDEECSAGAGGRATKRCGAAR